MKSQALPRKCGKQFVGYALLCLLFLCSPFLHAETERPLVKDEVFTIGTATIHEGNLALAKKRAISDALMKGVESYLINRLGGHGMINNFQRLVQGVIPGAREQIENFHILAEEKIGEEYKVLVGLRINKVVIDERLRLAGLVHTEGPPIKVLFLVSEMKDGTTSYWWNNPEIQPSLSATELALFSVFQERGFAPINRTLTTPEIEYFIEPRSPDLEDEDILVLGRLFSADVVVYGQSQITGKEGVSLSLKAYDLHQEIKLCEASRTEEVESGPGGDEGIIATLQRLINRLAGDLSPTIIQSVTAESTKVHHLKVTLKGLGSYKQLTAFRGFLRGNVKGIKSVKETRITRNSVSYEVEFRGDRDRFLDRVLNHKDLPFPFNLVRSEDGRIILTAR